MLARIRNEPALVLALVGAVIALVISFGFKLSPEQVGGIMALTSAALGFVTRSQVAPVADPPVS
jgi:hypothetical protein